MRLPRPPRCHASAKASSSAQVVFQPMLTRTVRVGELADRRRTPRARGSLERARRAGAAGRDREAHRVELDQQRDRAEPLGGDREHVRALRAEPQHLAVAREQVLEVVAVGIRGRPASRSRRPRAPRRSRARRAGSRCPAVAALLPAARLEHREIAHQQRADRRSARRACAPRPRSCRHRAAAPARPIASSRRGTARPPRAPAASAGVPSCGISTVPVSELIDWTATTARPGRASALGQRVDDRRAPVLVDRQDLGIGRGAEHRVVLDRRDQPPLGLGAAERRSPAPRSRPR